MFLKKKRLSHLGKKEVARIVSKPLVSCLWGCGESVESPPKLNIKEVQGALSSRPKGDPGPLPIFQYFLLFSLFFVGMWRVCKSSKMKHPGGSGGFVL